MVAFGVIRLRPDRGHLVLSRGTIMRARGRTGGNGLVSRLMTKSVIRKAITHLAGFNTFISLNNISNLIRVSRVTRRRIGGPKSILTVKRSIGIGVLSVSGRGNHMSLDVGSALTNP